MRTRTVLLLTALLLISALAPALPVEAGDDKRSDKDSGSLGEQWRVGLGTGIGALNAIKIADIDADGVDELMVGNIQGYLHILKWDAAANGFVDLWQSVELGGPVKAIEVGQIDDDEALEVAIGYYWGNEVGKVQIYDGATLRSERNWTNGVSFSVDANYAEQYPYGLAFGDLDNDGEVELAVGGDQGYLWVVDAITPEGPYGDGDYNVFCGDEAEWCKELTNYLGSEGQEDVWGMVIADLDTDDALEVAVGTKQGWVGVFDGETEALQWKKDMDGDSGLSGMSYGLLAADLDGNGENDLVVAQQSRLSIFHDAVETALLHENGIKSGYGLAAADLFGDSDPELVVADSSGDIFIISYDGTSITIEQNWDSGYPMNTGAGVAVSIDRNWAVHGGDRGVLVGWEITGPSTHSRAWDSLAAEGLETGLYSLPGGKAFGITAGNIDADGTPEILMGSAANQVYAFDGTTHRVDWVSPVLDEVPMSLVVADLDNDGDNEVVVGTGTPDETLFEGEGGEGYLYIFDDTGSGLTQVYKSGNLHQVMNAVVLELDGSLYPEIGLATSYTEIFSGNPAPPPEPHGRLRVYGYDGSNYGEEWSDDDQDMLVIGLAGGDADDDGSPELLGGYTNGLVRYYRHSSGDYVQDGSDINTGQNNAFGLAVFDVDDDTETEVLVGTAERGGSKARVQIYDGSSRAKERELERDDSSVLGIAGGDVDADHESEIIFSTTNGELFIRDGATLDTEAKTSALSRDVGYYGGLNLTDLDDDDNPELLVGSEAYGWVFETEGSTDKPDLAIYGEEILLGPENPDEDDDIQITVTLHNEGGVEALGWRVEIYDGDPDGGGSKITEYTCESGEGCPDTIPPGSSFTFERTWNHQSTSPGTHEVYAKARHLRQGGEPGETRLNNNKDYNTIYIEEIPNDPPVIDGYLDNVVVWVDEPVRLHTNESYDNETTNNEADGLDGVADLEYCYYPADSGGWTGWVTDYFWDFEFSTPGMRTVKAQTRDERRKESEIKEWLLDVRGNTQPVAVLLTNTTSVSLGGYVTFDVSESQDPDHRADLEYRFNFGDGVGTDWVSEGGSATKLYRNAVFNPTTGNFLSGDMVLNDDFQPRYFKLQGLKLLEVVDLSITNHGYNYTLESGDSSGNYFAQLMVRELPGGVGETDLLSSGWSDPVMVQVVRPANREPVAVATASYGDVTKTGTFPGVETGKFVTLSAEESYDPDGEIVQYMWTINGRTQPQFNRGIEKVFNEPGTYVATVEITDDRGATATASVTIIVQQAAVTDDDDNGSWPDLPMWLAAVAVGVPVLAAGAIAISRMRGGGEEGFDDFADGGLELACPTCGSNISITTPQRPIQVGCPICASQFILRE